MSFNLILKLHTVKCEIYPQVLAKRIVCFQAKLRFTDTSVQQTLQGFKFLWLERMRWLGTYAYYTIVLVEALR